LYKHFNDILWSDPFSTSPPSPPTPSPPLLHRPHGRRIRCAGGYRAYVPAPLLYLSAFFEATCEDNYARLLGVTEEGEWEEWIAYFLRGIAHQAEDALGRIRRIDDLLRIWRDRLAKATSRLPERAVELFVENPFWTVGRLAKRLDVAFTTAQRAIDRLGSGGIIAPTTEAKRNRVYCEREILSVLEEPPRLP
jgi:Fic family protein